MLASALLWPGSGSGHPGHSIPVTISGFAYSPSTATITVGEGVLWTWQGLDTNHTVTAVAGQDEQFDSDPGVPPAQIGHPLGSTFQHIFSLPGQYQYYCRVHSDIMRGTVIVKELPGNAPRLRKLKVRPRSFCTGDRECKRPRLVAVASKGAQLRWRIEELAGGEWRTARHPASLFLHKGRNSRRLPTAGLDEGRNRVVGRLVDSQARSSDTRKAGFELSEP